MQTLDRVGRLWSELWPTVSKIGVERVEIDMYSDVREGCLPDRLGAGLCKMAVGWGWGSGVGTRTSTEPCVPTVRWLGPGTHQEEAPGGPVLRADISDRGHAQEDAANWTKHVCSYRPGPHCAGQGPLCPGACPPLLVPHPAPRIPVNA